MQTMQNNFISDDTVVFLSDKPFIKYETARFDGGVYRTDDEEEIAMLMKSKYYGKGFRRLDDVAPGLSKSSNNIEPYDSPEEDLGAVIEREAVETQSIVEEFKEHKIDYNAMVWSDLRKHAAKRGINIKSMTKVEIINELEKLDVISD